MTLELTNDQAALVVAALIEKRNNVLKKLAVMPNQFVSQREDLEKLQNELVVIYKKILCTE